MTTGERIRNRRKELGISAETVAQKLGLSPATIYRYENGDIEKVPGDILEPLADILRTTPTYLMGWGESEKLPANIIPIPTMRKIPLLGAIACGEPILAVENYAGEVDIPEDIKADFALKCRGDSMINARIFDGDVVYIREQPLVNDGEIAAVLIGDEATLKRVRLYEDHVSLEPENPQYRPIVYWGEEMNKVRILGKAIAFTSRLEKFREV